MTRWLAALCALAAGCAHNVTAHYPEGCASTGTVIVRLSNAASNATVIVNGRLIVEDRHTARVKVHGVPAGRAVVEVSAGGDRETGVSERREVWVEPGREVAVTVAGPEMTTAQGIYAGFTTLGVWLVYAALIL